MLSTSNFALSIAQSAVDRQAAHTRTYAIDDRSMGNMSSKHQNNHQTMQRDGPKRVLKRARLSESDPISDTNKRPINQSINQFDQPVKTRSLLLEYGFILPLVIDFLNSFVERGIMMQLSRSIKPSIPPLMYKGHIDRAVHVMSTFKSTYLPVIVTDVFGWMNQDLTLFPHLKKVKCKYGYSLPWVEPIKPTTFPIGLTDLTFGRNFDQPLEPGMIPSSVTHLTFEKMFNQPLIPGTLPISAKHITFGFRFNQPIHPGVIPDGVTHLEFATYMPGMGSINSDSCFNQPLLPGSLPSDLIHLKLSPMFNQPIGEGVLPHGLRRLIFGYRFNQSLDRCIPSTVTHLELGVKFDQPYLVASSIKQLTLRNSCTLFALARPLPQSIEHLVVGRDWSSQVSNESLILESTNRVSHQPFTKTRQPRVIPPGLIPCSVTHLAVESPIVAGTIPVSVTNLTFGPSFNQVNLEPGQIPQSVKHVMFGEQFNHYLSPGTIPISVSQLSFTGDFNQPISLSIPQSVTELSLMSKFNQPLTSGCIPDSVEFLTLGMYFNQPLSTNVFPHSLINLSFGSDFNQPIHREVLPPRLKYIKFCGDFNQPFEADTIPTSVKLLTIGRAFTHLSTIPKTIQHLIVPRTTRIQMLMQNSTDQTINQSTSKM